MPNIQLCSIPWLIPIPACKSLLKGHIGIKNLTTFKLLTTRKPRWNVKRTSCWIILNNCTQFNLKHSAISMWLYFSLRQSVEVFSVQCSIRTKRFYEKWELLQLLHIGCVSVCLVVDARARTFFSSYPVLTPHTALAHSKLFSYSIVLL